MPTRRSLVLTSAAAAGVGVAALGVVAASYWRDEERRHRLERQARVWRLSARRVSQFLVLKVRGRTVSPEERVRLEERFAIRTAEDVAEVLGGMKGAIMKAGQMLSFLADGPPPEAQSALATLQADVPPMAPSLAENVVRDELGHDVNHLFLDCGSRAGRRCLHRSGPPGRDAGRAHRRRKVQYPGVDKAIRSDLDNEKLLNGMFASFALEGLDVKALVDELRARIADELDYDIEAACQAEFAILRRSSLCAHPRGGARAFEPAGSHLGMG